MIDKSSPYELRFSTMQTTGSTMAAKPRDAEILEAYEEWNPDEESVDALADRLGTTRQTLYNVLRRNNVLPKSQRTDAKRTSDMLEFMADQALDFMLHRITEQTREIDRLKEYVRSLRRHSEEHGVTDYPRYEGDL